jgi:hypothetical protein
MLSLPITLIILIITFGTLGFPVAQCSPRRSPTSSRASIG